VETLKEMLFRFVVGGLVVSAFSALGDVLKPKSFAGLFGAAPSVALATLALAIASHGVGYASLEGRSMIAGAAALLVYAFLTTWVMYRYKWSAVMVTGASLVVWFATALGSWALFLK
jgi:hypothetical protein